MGFLSTIADKWFGFDPPPPPPPPPRVDQAVKTTVQVAGPEIQQTIKLESPMAELAQAQVLAAHGQAADYVLNTLGQAVEVSQTESLRDLLRYQDELTFERERYQRQRLTVLALALGLLIVYSVQGARK